MPRKKKNEEKKLVSKSTTTYHKSKNGRYYKKTKSADGKCQCRFVSKAEGEGGMSGSSAKEKKE